MRAIRRLGLFALVVTLAGGAAAAEKTMTEDTALALGREAYVFGYPLVLMDVTRAQLTAVAKAGPWAGSPPRWTWDRASKAA